MLSALGLALRKYWKLVAVVLISSFAGLAGAHGQAMSTASKTMDISAFGGFLNVNPDYGRPRNDGVAAGVDVTRYFGWKVDPSLEFRFNDSSGPYITERSYLVGVRLQSDLRRFHPYADFLAGVGSIHFVKPLDPTYTHDSSPVYSYGGGVDIDLVRHFQAKVDYQGQTMSFDPYFSLAPRPLVIVIAYRIPFRPFVK
jgi:hypothetical protein